MAKKIFKYEMGIKEKQELELPIGAEIIRVDDKFFLWAIVNVPIEDEEIETETRFLEFYKTVDSLLKMTPTWFI